MLTQPTLRDQSVSGPQLFSAINRCATCCLSSRPAAKLTVNPCAEYLLFFVISLHGFKKKTSHFTEAALNSSARLSVTSIKPNECGAQAVRPWDIHSVNRVSNQRRQPSALSGINRSAIGARRVVECARGVVNRL